MPRYDANSAECLVYTFKEGLLSSVAHDLKIRVTRFELDIDAEAGSAQGTFDAASLRVVCATRDGTDAPGALKDKDRREIEESIVKDVLHSGKFPEVRFRSTSVEAVGDGYRLSGTLSLHGRDRATSFSVRRVGQRWEAEVPLHQPDFGIKPYRALLGALKVQADLKVCVSIPA